MRFSYIFASKHINMAGEQKNGIIMQWDETAGKGTIQAADDGAIISFDKADLQTSRPVMPRDSVNFTVSPKLPNGLKANGVKHN
ncbi:MAG: hypothetical protein JNL57_11345 [Bacteroidetes bacterium]|nr:hypothetical protein [Bacteroidota bacterium]